MWNRSSRNNLTDRLSRCMDECLGAMEKPQLDGYDPLKSPKTIVSPTLDNDKQAAAWMDCRCGLLVSC